MASSRIPGGRVQAYTPNRAEKQRNSRPARKAFPSSGRRNPMSNAVATASSGSAQAAVSEAEAAKLGKDVEAHSAGSAPSGRINPFALEALRNAGIDTSGSISAGVLKTFEGALERIEELDLLNPFDTP